MSDFTIEIDKWVAKANGDLQTFVTEFVQDLNEEIIRATPVDTGFLRGSWYASLNEQPVEIGVADRGGAVTVARLNLVAANMKVGDIYFLINGASYARFVEYGTVKMTPRAFVRNTVAAADRIADDVAQRIART